MLSLKLGAIVLATSSAALAQDHGAIVQKHIGPLVDAELIPGAVVGVYKDGVASFYPIGALAFDGDDAPAIETMYEIGSISKVMTGVLFADAIDRGEVERSTLVDDLLPDGYDAKDFEGVEITLEHLTTHRSGWVTAPLNLPIPEDPELPFNGYTQDMLFAAAGLMSPTFEPGTSFEYSNFAVGMLGTLIALRADASYEALTIERVLAPIGIREDFVITLSDAQRARLAPATSSGRSTKPWGSMGPMDPAGMWVATAPALLEFAIANLGDIETEFDQVLAAARAPIADNNFGGLVGHGWMIAADGSTVWHNGMTGGYSSTMLVNRVFDVAVVVLTNGATLATTQAGERLFIELVGELVPPIELGAMSERLTAAQTSPLVGHYKGEFFDVWITTQRGRIYAQLTNQQTIQVVPTDDPNRFRYTVVEAELVFDAAEDGKSAAVTLEQNGMVFRCERVTD